jgi:hypothetical protein
MAFNGPEWHLEWSEKRTYQNVNLIDSPCCRSYFKYPNNVVIHGYSQYFKMQALGDISWL